MAGYDTIPGPEGRTPRAPVRRLGAWKLAYADFLTALCALFIVMWLVTGASSEERAGLARQFGASQADIAPVPDIAQSRIFTAESTLRQSRLFAEETGQVSLQKHDSGLRIELIDLDRSPLFENGREDLNERGERLIAMATSALTKLGQPVSIEGHTDSQPVRRIGYSNWELSSGRANSARKALIAHGLPERLIASVAGFSDTRPLNPDAPYLPQNRRLSIVVHIDERP